MKRSVIVNKYTYKLFIFAAVCSGNLLLAGCSKNPSTDTVNPPITVLPITAAPTPFPENPTVAPTKEPTLSGIPTSGTDETEAELSSEDAKALILERLDITKYSVNLIDSTLALKGDMYYSFLVSEGNRIYEPALIVNKQSGEIFCYDSFGNLSDYSEFPLYNDALDAVCDWNGNFLRYDSAGSVTSELNLGQGDSHSFEFTLSTKNGFEENSMTGIASIQGNSASYLSPEGISLHFVMSEDALAVTEERQDSSVAGYAGIYYKSEQTPDLPTSLTKTQARELLSTLTKETTGLPAELSEYTLIADDLTIRIKDNLCYSIGVYTKEEERNLLLSTFYVALDGSRIFAFDLEAGDDVEIWNAK